jgi:uncharacterized membrane protein HdeD (DUF308 family)
VAVAIRGVLGVAVGVIALVLPAVTMLALVLLFAAYTLVDGVLAIVAAWRAARTHERWGLLALEGVADMLPASSRSCGRASPCSPSFCWSRPGPLFPAVWW